VLSDTAEGTSWRCWAALDFFLARPVFCLFEGVPLQFSLVVVAGSLPTRVVLLGGVSELASTVDGFGVTVADSPPS